MMPRFIRFVVMCCVIGFAMSARMASAYVPPADVLLKMFAEQRFDATLHDLFIRLSVQKPDENEARDEQLYFKKPARFRMVKAEAIYTEVDGVGSFQDGPPERLLAALWLGNDSAHLLTIFQGFGIDTANVGLGRMNNQVAYVLGGAGDQNDKPQIYFSKDALLPIRFIVKGMFEKSVEIIDVRFFYEQGSRYPNAIDYYVDGKFQEHAAVVKIQKNLNLSDTLFVIPKN